MNFIITADLHLTDNPHDEYRWEFLDWLAKQCDRYDVDYLFILGDLTDAKDRHSAKLVNRIVNTMRGLSPEIYILMGNHDFAGDIGTPFFDWWDEEGIRFISKPEKIQFDEGPLISFLPFKTGHAPYEQSWFSGDFAFMHQPLIGARAAHGYKVTEGYDPKKVKGDALVFAGDIHVPQKVGRVEYVGSPYPINFGDVHEPRVILYEGDQRYDVPSYSIQKLKVTIKEAEDLYDWNWEEGDQVKVVVQVSRKNFDQYDAIKDRVRVIANELNIQVRSIELQERKKRVRASLDKPDPVVLNERKPNDLLEVFASDRGLSDAVRTAGQRLIEE